MSLLAKKYKYFLFDQWGVLHDGDKIFEFTNNTLSKLKKKKLILISNTSQTVTEFKFQTLKKINLKFKYFDKIITAGESLYKINLNSSESIFSKILKLKKALVISNKGEKKLLKKLKIKLANKYSCNFILSLSLEPKCNLKNILKTVKFLSKRKLPMICTNPDIYTFKEGVRYYQIGYVAEMYKKFGGNVYYVGKPYKNIFNSLEHTVDKKKTLIIGDNLQTDIAGGKNFGIKTVLCLDGFKKLNNISNNKLAIQIIKKKKIFPNYIINNIAIN